MKTISGNSVSMKQISLSKAAKILSKFVSAENGASQVLSTYLHRASTSFNELNQLHKELRSSRSHKKHRRHKTETQDDRGRVMENSIRSVETNEELNDGHVQSKHKSRRHQSGSENNDEDDEKSTRTVVKLGQIKEKKKYEAGSENNLYAEEVKMVQKKRKNEDVEGRVEDRSGDLNKKRTKRKHKGDNQL